MIIWNNLIFSLVYRIPPFYYLHVLDQNSNVTRLEVGPKTFVKQDHEKVILGPERMLIIPYVWDNFSSFVNKWISFE
jgi:hypothetical protein